MAWLFLALGACDGALGGTNQTLDATGFWPAAVGTFYTMRLLDAGASPVQDTAALDASALLLARVAEGGCADGTGIVLGLRSGDAWDDGEPRGDLHFSLPTANADESLALCGYADALGSAGTIDPPVVLWDGGKLVLGEEIAEGSWSVTTADASPTATYFGVFPDAVSFAIAGPGDGPSGWTMVLAPGTGLVVLETGTFTADLVNVR